MVKKKKKKRKEANVTTQYAYEFPAKTACHELYSLLYAN